MTTLAVEMLEIALLEDAIRTQDLVSVDRVVDMLGDEVGTCQRVGLRRRGLLCSTYGVPEENGVAKAIPVTLTLIQIPPPALETLEYLKRRDFMLKCFCGEC